MKFFFQASDVEIDIEMMFFVGLEHGTSKRPIFSKVNKDPERLKPFTKFLINFHVPNKKILINIL